MLTTRSKKFLYADDLKLAFHTKDFSEGEAALSQDLQVLNKYYKKWRLYPNPFIIPIVWLADNCPYI